MKLDLSAQSWTLVGWVPFTWTWLASSGQDITSPTADLRKHQCTPEIPTQIPGSVQDDLLRAGLLPDWNAGLNAPLCEWVEHRHWEYRCALEVPAEWTGQRIILRAEALDYVGHILVDGKVVASFEGMLMPHEFDLTQALKPGARQHLSILFEEAPHEQGQIGYTSRSHFFKSRYAYGWDWCPRMVPLGIWDKLTRLALLLLFVAVLLLVAVWYLPLIKQNERYRRNILQLDTRIQRALDEGKQLKASYEALRHDPKAVERLARERLGYARTGETLIRFEAPLTNALPRQ